MSFDSLGLHDYMLTSIGHVGYKRPTPIQKEAIPLILEGNDLIAHAHTGTGKTAAFALPILQVLNGAARKQKKQNIQALILTPTRELALQVANAVDVLAQCTERKIRILPLIGGEKIDAQLKELRYGFDVVVATPGRLIEVIKEKNIRLMELKFLVIDEADKMLDLGFADELQEVMKAVPKERQTMLFSATFPDKVAELAENVLVNPIHISTVTDVPTVSHITQRVIEVNRENRGQLLRHLVKTEEWKHVLIFVSSKRSARNVATKLQRDGISAEAFHGDLTQSQRTFALSQFRNRNVQVLVATDLAARGIDIHKLSYVLNYDLPRSPSDYIHRIGRTGRAGAKGIAVSFVGHEDMDHFALIEKRTKQTLEREQVEGFELTGEAPVKKKGAAPVKGKRKSKKDKAREAALKGKAGEPAQNDSVSEPTQNDSVSEPTQNDSVSEEPKAE